MQTNWIDNRAVPSHSNDDIAIVNPSNEEVITSAPRGSRADVNQAVEAARRAHPGWAALSPVQRRNALRQVANQMRENAPDLSKLLTRENGKPLAQATLEINGAIDMALAYAELCVHLRSGNQGALAGELSFQHRQSRGVAACIVPWNYPVLAGFGNVIPNLAVGNTVVWKPSEKTPLTSRMLVEKCFAGLPSGVLNMVLGDGPNAGAHLVEHPQVNVVAFIGSERTGRQVGEVCGRLLKKCVLELGGKDPLIVDETVDIAAAARLAAEATYANAGQICTSTERLYVHRRVFDEFIDALAAVSAAIRVGDGMLQETQMGPLVDHLQLAKVASHAEEAVQLGAAVRYGGKRLDRKGYYFPPTILTGVEHDMLIMKEETFGPIAPVIPFDDFDQAIALANDSRYGLSAIVCTTSAPRAIKAIQELEASMVKINTMRGRTAGATSEPFKSSGMGQGYGIEILQELTIQKSVHWRGAPT